MHKMPNGKMMKDSAMKKMSMGGMGYAKGGMIATPMGKVASGGKRPHGEHTVQTKGMTKGTMIKMKSGGRAC